MLGTYLLTRCGDNGYAMVSHQRIVADLTMSVSSITRAFAQLERIKLFNATKLPRNRGQCYRAKYSEAEIVSELERYKAQITTLKNGDASHLNDYGGAHTEHARSTHTEHPHTPQGMPTQSTPGHGGALADKTALSHSAP